MTDMVVNYATCIPTVGDDTNGKNKGSNDDNKGDNPRSMTTHFNCSSHYKHAQYIVIAQSIGT